MENTQNKLGQLPFMPTPKVNLQYMMDWWKGKSMAGIDVKGGSFNKELYLALLDKRNKED